MGLCCVVNGGQGECPSGHPSLRNADEAGHPLSGRHLPPQAVRCLSAPFQPYPPDPRERRPFPRNLSPRCGVASISRMMRMMPKRRGYLPAGRTSRPPIHRKGNRSRLPFSVHTRHGSSLSLCRLRDKSPNRQESCLDSRRGLVYSQASRCTLTSHRRVHRRVRRCERHATCTPPIAGSRDPGSIPEHATSGYIDTASGGGHAAW